MDHVDARAIPFGCVDQLQRYSSNALEFHAVSHSMASHAAINPAEYNTDSSRGNSMMLNQGITSSNNCDPLTTMHDFPMTQTSCNIPLGLAPFRPGSGNLSSMLALSSGFQPANSAFGQPHSIPSSSMYPYLQPGGMQSFLQAATPAQFPFQNFSTLGTSFPSGLNPTAARAFSCFRPVSVSDQNVLLPNAEMAQSQLCNYSQANSASFVDSEGLSRQPSISTRFLVNSSLPVDPNMLNISSFFNLQTSSPVTPSVSHDIQDARSDNMSQVSPNACASSVATDGQSSSGQSINKASPSSRRRRFASTKASQSDELCLGMTSHVDGMGFETTPSCTSTQGLGSHGLTSDCMTNSSENGRLHLDSFMFNMSVADGDYNAHKVLLHGNEFDQDLHDIDCDEDLKTDLLTLPEDASSDNNCAMNEDVNIEEHQCVTVEGVRRWRCLECPKVYSTKHNLVTHTLGHRGIKPHRCSTCGKYFKQISHLQTHALTHASVKPHTCTVCSRGFTQASHVKRHMAVHMDQRLHSCSYCQRSFAFPSELRSHIDKLHKQSENAAAPALTCKLCDATFDSCESLRSHRIQAHRCRDHRIMINTAPGAASSGSLMCNVCSKVFTYPSQLRDHAMKHEGRRPFMCTECGMDFMKDHHLKAHQFTHTGLRPYVCHVCNRAFNQKANLQRHQLVHDGDRKFACEICGRSFTQMQVLRAHLVTHQETKPFQCKVCGKGFTRLHNLNGHLHMHDGDKPFVCSCGASFTLKGNLNRHKKDKHRIRDDHSLTVVSTTNEEFAIVAKKKKRKSMPPRKNVVSVGSVHDDDDEPGNDLDDKEVSTAWQLNEDDEEDEDEDDDEEYDDEVSAQCVNGNGDSVTQAVQLHELMASDGHIDVDNSKTNCIPTNFQTSSRVLMENSELRTFSNLTAVSAFTFDAGLHTSATDDELGSWQLADCVPVKSEDLSHIDSELNHIAGNEQSLSAARSLFKVADANSFRDVVDSDQGATTSMECYSAAVSRRSTDDEIHADSNHGMAVVGQNSQLRQTARTARIGKAASLAVLMASHKDSTKCDST